MGKECLPIYFVPISPSSKRTDLRMVLSDVEFKDWLKRIFSVTILKPDAEAQVYLIYSIPYCHYYL
jgi:hypothetical protein